jgi:hypothetical protein
VINKILAFCAVLALSGCFIVESGDALVAVRERLGSTTQPIESGVYWKIGVDGIVENSDDLYVIRRAQVDGVASYAFNSGHVRFYAIDGSRYIVELIDEAEFGSVGHSKFSIVDVRGADVYSYDLTCSDIPEVFREVNGIGADDPLNCQFTDPSLLVRSLGLAVADQEPESIFRLMTSLPDRQ